MRVHNEDLFVIILIVVIAVVWGIIGLRRWLEAPARRVDLDLGEEVPTDDTVELLEASGYEVVSGKKRIPITVVVDDEEELHSRLYIDYFARKDDGNRLYAVKVAKDRKPLDMTGSGIRDALLPYYLLYDEVSGVLYVDTKQGTIKQFHFEIED